MKINEFKPTESVRRRNPQLWPGSGLAKLPAEIGKPNSGSALVSQTSRSQTRKYRVGDGSRPLLTVTIIACVNHLHDSDNIGQGAYKGLRDAIADWFGLDDNDQTVRWEYGQIKRSQQGTIVKIEQPK